MHRIVFAAVLCAGITFGAQAKFVFLEEGYFSGSDYLNALHSDDLRFAYMAGLVDGQRAAHMLDTAQDGKSSWLAACILSKGLGAVQPAYEQDLRNHAEKMLRPVNQTFYEFVEEHVC